MPLTIIVLMGIFFFYIIYKEGCYEAQRLEEKSRQQREWYEKMLDEEAKEVNARCAGKPVEEQVRIREEFCARLEADMKRTEARLKEIERREKAEERAQQAAYRKSQETTREALIFMSGLALGSMGKRDGSGGSSRRRSRSSSCGCTCEACLEGRHEDCHSGCEFW